MARGARKVTAPDSGLLQKGRRVGDEGQFREGKGQAAPGDVQSAKHEEGQNREFSFNLSISYSPLDMDRWL